MENLSKRSNEPLALDVREFERNERAALLTLRINSLRKQMAHTEGAQLEFLKKRTEHAVKEFAKVEKEKDTSALVAPGVVFTAIPLTRKIEPDKTVNTRLVNYDENIPLLVNKCEENIHCPKADVHQGSYVGANTCKACHAQAFLIWEHAIFARKGLDETGHEITATTRPQQQAWQTLVDKNKDSDRSCVPGCHLASDLWKKVGYCKVSDVGSFKNVAKCRSCHGQEAFMRKAAKKT